VLSEKVSHFPSIDNLGLDDDDDDGGVRSPLGICILDVKSLVVL
jgi:hypothetical protein